MSEDTGGRLPFEGSEEIADIISGIITNYSIESFVETGTQRGATCRWVAEKFPDLAVTTIEINREYFWEAFENLRDTSVMQMVGDSSEQLIRLRFLKGERVLFYLDAHGCGTDRTPLLEELEAIHALMLNYEIVPWIAIHDFQVPGRPELGFDRYGEQIINGEFITPQLLRMGFLGQELRYNSVPDGAARGLAYIGFKQAAWK